MASLAVTNNMNISALPAVNPATVATNDPIGITMLKKSMDIQESQALQLIQSVAQSVPTPKPVPSGNLGNNIDIRA